MIEQLEKNLTSVIDSIEPVLLKLDPVIVPQETINKKNELQTRLRKFLKESRDMRQLLRQIHNIVPPDALKRNFLAG